MIGPGFTINNSYSQTRILVLPSANATEGTGWLLEVRRPPGAGPDNSEHFHRTWTETFEVIEGQAYYRLDGVQGRLRAGDQIAMPPRVPHVHPWNAGDGELIYRQSAAFMPPDPQAMQEVIGGIATIARIAAEGGLAGPGKPRHLLQQAVTLKLALKYGRYDARIPAWVQRLIATTLGRLGAALGYAAIDPRYRQPAAAGESMGA